MTTTSDEASVTQLHPADTFTNADPDLPWFQARCTGCGWHPYPTQDEDEQELWRVMHMRDRGMLCWPISNSTVLQLPRGGG